MTTRRDFRLTKIICTLGPASWESDVIEDMAKKGMNVARLNMSHGDRESHLLAIRRVRSLNRKLNHPIALLMDLQGPEIRTGEVREQLSLHPGEIFSVSVRPNFDPEERSIQVDYQDMLRQLHPGDKITVDNGLINLEVLEVRDPCGCDPGYERIPGRVYQ